MRYQFALHIMIPFLMAAVLVSGACSPAASPEASSTPPPPSPSATSEPTETLEPTQTPTPTEIPLTDVERSFNPPEGYRVDQLVHPPIGDLFTVAVSESGRIYAQSINEANLGIYLYNPDTDTMDLVNDGAAGGIHIFGGQGILCSSVMIRIRL